MRKSTDIKRIDIKEFREKGYLQELNRRFLHPLGLGLEVVLDDETGEESLGGVWDSREEDEGIYYDLKNSEKNRISIFKEKKKFIDDELKSRSEKRIDSLGFNIEDV